MESLWGPWRVYQLVTPRPHGISQGTRKLIQKSTVIKKIKKIIESGFKVPSHLLNTSLGLRKVYKYSIRNFNPNKFFEGEVEIISYIIKILGCFMKPNQTLTQYVSPTQYVLKARL